MKSSLIFTGIIVIALMWTGIETQASEPIYIGVKGCTKACHKKERDGDQRSVWRKSKHSQAFKTLGTDEAKEKAVELDISENPQKVAACLICHTTGYGTDAKLFKKKFKTEDGVQCEACHGAGNNYRKKKVMKKILRERGADRKGESPTAKESGLTYPGEKECKKCHVPEIEWNGNIFKNPSYDEEFDFEKEFEEIVHRVPDKKRESVAKGGEKDDEDKEEEE